MHLLQATWVAWDYGSEPHPTASCLGGPLACHLPPAFSFWTHTCTTLQLPLFYTAVVLGGCCGSYITHISYLPRLLHLSPTRPTTTRLPTTETGPTLQFPDLIWTSPLLAER